jgi:hypothetical protein
MNTIASRCNCDDPEALQGLWAESRSGAPHRRLVPFVPALTAALLGIAGIGSAQSLPDLYRITKGVSQYHVEYHQVSLSKGAELVLADLAGPGIWCRWSGIFRASPGILGYAALVFWLIL